MRRNVTGRESERSQQPANQGFTLWFTGLSGAGKSTIARLVADNRVPGAKGRDSRR